MRPGKYGSATHEACCFAGGCFEEVCAWVCVFIDRAVRQVNPFSPKFCMVILNQVDLQKLLGSNSVTVG